MATKLPVEAFLQKASTIPVIDVRSPGEFTTGHIANAINIPLFSNEERAKVGTLYKQQGKNAAIFAGLDIVGPKLKPMAKEAVKQAKNQQLLLHCWRGGMRSESMAWLFEKAGIECFLLEGGYKAYRQYLKRELEKPASILILGGMTGTGKTDILHALKAKGEQIIDLEGLANHKGSAFGAFGQEPQPPNELFENRLGEAWLEIDRTKNIWLEDESKSIGANWIPQELFDQMRKASVIKIELPHQCRIERLVKDYTNFPKTMLIEGIEKIRKRLGGQHANAAIAAINNDDFATAVDISLVYYDKAYNHGLSKRDTSKMRICQLPDNNAMENAQRLINFINSL